MLFGAGGVALGFPLADPIVGLLITIAILAVLRTAVREMFRRLMDGVDPELVDAAEAALAAEPGVRSVRSVKMRWIGHRLHADAELDIDPATSLTDAHQIAHEAEHTLTHAVPKLSTALIHAYPAHNAGPPDAIKRWLPASSGDNGYRDEVVFEKREAILGEVVAGVVKK